VWVGDLFRSAPRLPYSRGWAFSTQFLTLPAWRLQGERSHTYPEAENVPGLKNYLILACYLWVVFASFVLYSSVILSEHHIPFAPHGFAFINALVLARVILVAQRFVGEWLNEMPLIYTTLLKSVAFAVLLGCLKIIEETLRGLYRGLSYNESILVAVGGGTLTGALVFMAILAVVLIPFFAFTELSSVLGEERFKTLLFTPRRAAGR
jgi:hypothetical protein